MAAIPSDPHLDASFLKATHSTPTDGSEMTGGFTVKEAEETIKKGIPPGAAKIALVDFDGTIYPFGFLFDYSVQPISGAKEVIQGLKDKGYKIIIFTSRYSKRWLRTVNQTKEQHYKFIKTVMTRDGIPFDRITAEKIPAEFYIDDRAIGFRGDWSAVQAEIDSREIGGER